MLKSHLVGFGHFGVEHSVELSDFVVPVGISLCNLVKAFLYRCGEVIIKHIREIFGQKFIDHHAGIGGEKFALVGSCGFRAARACDLAVCEGEGEQRVFLAGAVAFLHIATLLDGRDGRGIGRRTPDAELLHLFHQ